jgi:phosphatidate cytidylyltransferase
MCAAQSGAAACPKDYMLIPRIITAVVLLAMLLPALFATNSSPFAALTLVLIAAGCWEWGRLNQLGFAASVVAGVAVGAGLAYVWWLAPHLLVEYAHVTRALWLLGAALWVLGSAWLLRFGMTRWLGLSPKLRLGVGWLLLALTWLAMASAHAVGVNFLLSVMVLVWVADVAAYFGGRAWGKRKLAAGISPGKTWAGAFSGAAAVMVLAVAWLWLDTQLAPDSASIYTQLWQRSPVLMVIGVLWLNSMAVVGDLIESLVKRCAGVKDSSGLLPGHGGVLDRVDALLPVLPLALMLVTV